MHADVCHEFELTSELTNDRTCGASCAFEVEEWAEERRVEARCVCLKGVRGRNEHQTDICHDTEPTSDLTSDLTCGASCALEVGEWDKERRVEARCVWLRGVGGRNERHADACHDTELTNELTCCLSCHGRKAIIVQGGLQRWCCPALCHARFVVHGIGQVISIIAACVCYMQGIWGHALYHARRIVHAREQGSTISVAPPAR